MSQLDIQNWLIFFTLITTLCLSIRSAGQSKKALNVDINFRALDKRKKLLSKLEKTLVFFTDELDSDGYVYPLLKDSEKYDLQFNGEEEDHSGPPSPELGDMLRESENATELLQEAALLFPKAKQEIENLSKQFPRFVDVWHMNNKEDFNKTQEMLKKTSEKALSLMKKHIDITNFPNFGY